MIVVSSSIRYSLIDREDNLIIVNSATGSYIYTDKNRYVDLISGYGSILIGHSDEELVNYQKDILEYGTSTGIHSKEEEELKDLLRISLSLNNDTDIIFSNSGNESIQLAVEFSRKLTNKKYIIIFDVSYHGFTLQEDPYVIKCTYRDISTFISLLDNYEDRIASIVIEPIPSNLGLIIPDDSFIKSIIEESKRRGIIIILDETITLFRTKFTGYFNQARECDILVFGKSLSGGLPFSGLVILNDSIGKLYKDKSLYRGSTFAGNLLSICTAKYILNYLNNDPNIYDRLNDITLRIVNHIISTANDFNLKIHISYRTSIISFIFTDIDINYSNYKLWFESQNYTFYKNLYFHMLSYGTLISPLPSEPFYINISLIDDNEALNILLNSIYMSFKSLNKMLSYER